MDIQVWSDVTCPWCYIGKARLERTLQLVDGAVTVTYRAFQLNAVPVPEPILVKQVMSETLGGPERAEEMFTRVTAMAASEGLRLDFDRAVAANTFAAHRLIAWAATQDRQADMLDALQRAHFSEGIDIGSLSAIARVAGSIGLDSAAALAHLESEAATIAVNTDIEEARALGISSVPTFVIDGKYALPGAHDTETLLSALEEIARRESANAGL
ncbi:DsbA family oxidoreductase [Actinoplanes philippinensis]|uniref:DsbA family oxidoreductase n=1 Tax=Actinoplanes philippinensis TaxID=35752 RepID=UPI0033C179F8